MEATKSFMLPADHKLGMKVPKGGSSCMSCEHLGKDGKSCEAQIFIKWNGSTKLPAPADEYCCDLYEERPNFLLKIIKGVK